MARHTIFLVHGMGDSSAGWSEPIQKKFKELYAQFPSLGLMPFDENFEFAEILYNNIFDSIRDQWRNNNQAVLDIISSGAAQSSHSKRKEASSAISGLATFATGASKEEFLQTHVLDVVMYRFSVTIRQRVQANVRSQILQVLAAMPQNAPRRWSIIAYSLGTAVIHDTLQAMYSEPDAPLPPGVTRPTLLAMIANVSRVLETDSDPFTSLVRPTTPDNTAAGVCDYLLNARHESDVLTLPKCFRPVKDWPDLATRTDRRFREVLINAFADKNVHALEHYLGDPAVHCELLRLLTFDASISESAQKNAEDRYEASTPLGKFAAYKKQLKKVWLSEEAEWKEIIPNFAQFLALAKEE